VVLTFPIRVPSTGEYDSIISPEEKLLEPVEVPSLISSRPNVSKASSIPNSISLLS